MANANISHITFSNTFSDWRGATNDLSNSINNMRNTDYVRDGGDNLEIKNGRVFIAKTSGTTLDVTANVNIANNLITKTMIINDTASFNGDDARFTNTNVIVDIANTLAVKNLTSNTFIHAQNVITQDLIVGSDDSGECWIQGDPAPSKKPLFVNGVFQNLDRGLNFIQAGIASVFVTANSANTKVIDIFAEVPLLDGERGIKGEKGEVGENGDVGFDGVEGTKGDKGEANVTGDLGDAGDKGLTGENVGGIPGEKGEPGDKGDPGFGQQGDKGDKGDKGDAIGATKGEKGEKGDTGEKGQEGFPNTNGSKGELGEKGDLGLIGDKGNSFDASSDLVKAFVNFGGGFGTFTPVRVDSSYNVSSVSLSGLNYTINFTGGLMSDSNYSVIGSATKPNSSDSSFYYSGTAHMQVVRKNAGGVTVTFALSGEDINNTTFYRPRDADVIIIR